MPVRVSIVPVVLLALALSIGAVRTEAQQRDLQAALDSALTALDAPGGSAAVIFANGEEWTGVGGLAAPGMPVTTGTAFELGSVTKTYTAAVVLLLVDDGRLRLDDPLARWHPDLVGAESITIGQLLNHTHGLHDPLQESDFVPAVLQDPTRVWGLDVVLERMRAPDFEPGAGWRYSNTGYHLLGAIVEAVEGKAFADVLEARIFEPAGLGQTWYGAQDPPDVPLAAAYIDPDGSGRAQPVSLLMPWTAFRTSAGPAGAVVATALDAARWLRALTGGTILTEEGWARMTRWVERPDGHRYGLGLLQLEREQGPLIGHKGNSAGYSASVFHEPASGITVAVLTNAHAVDVTPIADVLLRTAKAQR